MKTDQELRNSFEISIIDQNIIYIVITEAQPNEADNGRQAEILAEAIGEAVSHHPDISFNFLIDLTKAGSVSYISPKARQVYTDLPKISKFNKAAIIGQSLILEVTVNLLMQATGRGQSFKWFTEERQAKEWLMNQ